MMRNQSGRLVVIGDANPDIVLSGSDMTPAFGQAETLVDHAELSLGGSAAITAAAAAGMGVPTLLVAAVGRDTFGDIVTSQLAAAGVDTSALQRVAEPTGVTVVLSRGPDRAILTAPGAIGTLRAESVSDSDALDGAAHVHVSSYYLQPALAAGLTNLLAAARAAGATTSLDTNYDPAGTWLTPDLAATLNMVDLFFPNLAEAKALSGRDHPADAARWLAERFDIAAVVKCGARGAVLAAGSTLLQEPAPPVRVVDTTGAGDAFNAGFLAAWLDRGSPDAHDDHAEQDAHADRATWILCLRTAVAAGSAATTAVGAASTLTWKTVQAVRTADMRPAV